MTVDMLVSALHFVFVFALVAILAAQAALIRPGMTAASLRITALLDRGYGAGALLLLGAGFGRVFFGAKGAQFYLANPLFWTKIVLFFAVALLSLPPTLQLIRWNREVRAQSGTLPAEDQVRGVRRWLLAEAIVLFCIPFVAALMARGVGYG